MNNGIFGYGTGRVNGYRQLEKSADTAPARTGTASGNEEVQKSAARPVSLGSDLSDAEAGMINRYFPKTEQMELRLYGPGKKSQSVHPNGVGRRLDLRG